MHRCLSIVEIQAIIDLLLPKHDLAAVAQTCTTLSSTALDTLYHTVDKLSLFLRVLPNDLIEIGGTSWRARIHFKRPMTDSDWDRFQFYSERVRKLSLLGLECDPKCGRIDSAAMATLHLSAPSLPLFPNARELSISTITATTIIPYARCFLGPNIESIAIGGYEDAEKDLTPLHVRSFLSQLHRYSPNVRFALFGAIGEHVTDVSECISRWNGLESLILGGATNDLLKRISLSRRLKTFKLGPNPYPTLVKPTKFDTGSGDGIDNSFHELQELQLEAPLNVIRGVVDGMPTNTVLRRISLQFDAIEDADKWKDLFQHLTARLDEDQFPRLTVSDQAPIRRDIDGQDGEWNDSPSRIITYHHISPLLSFANFVKVDIQPTAGFDLDDNTLVQMAKSWRYLQHLSLGTSARIQTQRKSRFSFEAIIYLAVMCPHLAHLGISVDTPTITVIPSWTKPVKGHYNLNILNLDVGISPLPGNLVGKVASILSSVMPRLQRIQSFDGPESSDIEEEMEDGEEFDERCVKWAEVERLIPSFVSARRQEVDFVLEHVQPAKNMQRGDQ